MKVLILSTYEKTGGAAIATSRLLRALQRNGIDATMLCRRNITWGPKALRKQSWTSIWERYVIWRNNGFTRKGLWTTDIANCGQDITVTKEYREADVIHLHWINQGFLSLRTIEKIVKSGKRIVWTMHDEWPLDSVWHYRYGERDDALAQRVMQEKRRIYSQGRITFVACSRWLRDIAAAKPLAEGQEIVAVPNAIDTEMFRPAGERTPGRVLFVAQNVNDERKGLRYLNEAAGMLPDVDIVALGRDIPYVSDLREMAALYAGACVFVTPSLQDNLPNTIMESMACGTPCVGFNVGGIPEMIDHMKTGYVAEYKNSADLAEGIRYVLGHSGELGCAAREKVLREYSEDVIAKKYTEVYNA